MKNVNRTALSAQQNPDNPYEKGFREGVEQLSNQELLAIVIRNGTRVRNALEIAGDVLQYQEEGLRNLCTLTVDEFQEIHGIGAIKALELKACAEIARRITMQERREVISLDSPGSIANYFMEQMTYLTHEEIYLCFFNYKLHIIGQECISTGSNHQSFFSVPDILRAVYRRQADGFVLLHNHPSGNPTPSSDDVAITRHLYDAAKIVGLHFHDHIIIGDHVYYSFFEHGNLISREET